MSATERRACQSCRQEFEIPDEDLDFYKKIDVPPPTFCWICRAQRRMAFRNERALFKRMSSLSGKEVFATYPADVPFPVYTQEEWFSDQWNPLDHGQDYDFSKPFFQQFKELSDRVPKPAKSITGFLVGSDYSNNATSLRNCYLVFNASYAENCAYSNSLTNCNFCFDTSSAGQAELAYENFSVTRSSRVFWSADIVDSTGIYFSKDLVGCNDCFGCVNLRKKNYHIFNQPYSREDYFKELEKLDFGSHRRLAEIRERAEKFWTAFPVKFRKDGAKSVNVSGEYVYESKNAHYMYQAIGAEDSKYCQYVTVPSTKDSYDITVYGERIERSYESAMAGGDAYGVKFSLQTYSGVRNTEYCEYCTSSANLFGCVSVRNGEYCILNKQYTKEEYEALVPRIRKHMDDMPYIDKAGRKYGYGEFFPAEFSYFGYNETIAQEHLPLSKEEALRQGFGWKDVEVKRHTVTRPVGEIPDHIKDVGDDILKEVVGCEHAAACAHGCTGAFRVTAEELQFYRRFNIALPRLCVNCRHRQRLTKRNTMRLWQRRCQCAGAAAKDGAYSNANQHFHGADACPNEFETAYAPDRPEIVYCEQCYQAEVA